MASIYYRGKPPGGSWWLQFYHPDTRALTRFSLGTRDEARADLVRRKAEAELELLDPAVRSVEFPRGLAARLGLETAPGRLSQQNKTQDYGSLNPRPMPVAEAIERYLAHIRAENAPHHVAGKISILRRFFGCGLLPYKRPPSNGKIAKGVFSGRTIGEVTPAEILGFLESSGLARKSQRHYREVFHDFFEFLLRAGAIEPRNFHTPNPMGALPGFNQNGRKLIVFLSAADKKLQEEALRRHPSLMAGYKLMVEAGLRRSEALWLRRGDIRPDLSHFSVVNHLDPDAAAASRLKTSASSRPVTILPALRDFLSDYLNDLEGDWVVPSPSGKRWHKDNFSAALRKVNAGNNLKWSSMHYRHTFATERAGEGWTLWDLANEMGTSVAMIESNYAAYIRPSRLQSAPKNQ